MRKLLLLIIAIPFISCKPASRVVADATMDKIVSGKLKFEFMNKIAYFHLSRILWQQEYYKKNELPPYDDLFTDNFYFPDGINKYELVEQEEQKEKLIKAAEYNRAAYNLYNFEQKTYEGFVQYRLNQCKKEGGMDFPDIQCCFSTSEYETANYTYICHSSVAKYRLTIRMVKEFNTWKCGAMYYFEI